MKQDLRAGPAAAEMRDRASFPFFLALRVVSLLLILAAGVFVFYKWTEFSRLPDVLPAGSRLAGIPVGGLSREDALARLQAAYNRPIELRYQGASLLLQPEQAGFKLDLDAMLPSPASPTTQQRLSAFRDWLWDRPLLPVEASLAWSYDQALLRSYLETEIAPRYDQPALQAGLLPGALAFRRGRPGVALDVDASLPLIVAALPELAPAPIDLPSRSLEAPTLPFSSLELLLRRVIASDGFTGLAGVYLQDLNTGDTIHFATRGGAEVPVQPEIAFTASSIIKIPILVSVFRRLDAPPDATTSFLFDKMISESSNDAADMLMKTVLDEVRGPLLVTEDLRALGLNDSFLAGYFALGSPLLDIFETPANSRTDISTQPDPYSQATMADIGALLAEIYTCAQIGSGKLVEVFPGQITQDECRQMIEILKTNHQPYLITAGLPDGATIAHKHGYGSANEVINTIGDAAIVFTPGGDYVLVVWLNNPELLLWDPANKLVADLSTAVYSYFDPYPAGEGGASASQ